MNTRSTIKQEPTGRAAPRLKLYLEPLEERFAPTQLHLMGRPPIDPEARMSFTHLFRTSFALSGD